MPVFIYGTSFSSKEKTAVSNRTISFDENWHFIKDNPAGAETPGFDDSGWRTLDLPHDWSIEDLPDQDGVNVIGPFSKVSPGKMGTGYFIGGTAWYRKSFTISKEDKDKIAYLLFEGVYMNSDVWINGKHLGNHPYGYTSFYYDITPFLNPAGQPNVVAVQVKNEGVNARWYSGSGIYRHTWLTLVNPVHVGVWGTCVTTPVVKEKSAEVNISTTLKNSGKEGASVTVKVQIMDSYGKVVGTATGNSKVASGQTAEASQTIELETPSLWSLEKPILYDALVTVLINKKEVDRVKTTFGIRSIKFDTTNGFTLNGKTIKLRGGCFHHDNGPLGAAAIDRAEERKIEILKKAGFNAIRTSHNPPSPYLLDVCDRLGMLVIDEFTDMWEKPKGGPETYSKYFKANWKSDLGSILLRDRNHPAVIMWSIGNEIPEADDTTGLRIARNLVDVVKKYDLTRPVTEALVDMSAMGGKPWDAKAPHMALLDVIGYNYGHNRYEPDHIKYPERIGYTSEFNPPLSLQNWQKVEALPYVIGNFSWTAMDYMGESGTGVPRLVDIKPNETVIDPRQEIPTREVIPVLMMFFQQNSWPMFVNYQGDIDLIGNPKVPYYYQHVVWRDIKVSMFVHKPIPDGKREVVSRWGFPDELKSWNWEGHEGEKMQVHVYTRSKLVKLELNGKPVGEQAVDDSKSITATFEVPYEPGTLTARCFDNCVETSSETIKTVGKPAAIRLSADRSTIKADGNDLSYVMVEIVDAEGNIVPNADNIMVNFEISGTGDIAGLGSGSPTDMSSFQQPRKKTWQGRCLVIVRPEVTPGKIVIKAKSDGLKESSLEIKAL
jgi:beta-galactosidase